ncbi:energy transducer TonB [Bernardetia sp. Wsw4-3y2]|uniref:energy transducer TonB n=1 Tax=unclassified Bernardetia TaxID=2647129 RepID=UPI0030D36B1E
MKLLIITFLSILFLFTNTNLAFSQWNDTSVDTIFYSYEAGEITLRSEADYYRVIEKIQKDWEYREYYMNDVLKYKGTYSDKKLSKPKGSVYKYDEKGVLREEYKLNKDNTKEYVQIYSKEGKPLLENGSAFVTSDDGKEGTLYKDYKVVENYTVNEEGKKIYLRTAGESAMNKTEIEKFYIHISNTMNYPLEARRKGIQGRVFVQLIIDETGKVQDTKVLKGIGGGCDEEALKAVENYTEWKAATNHTGEKVAVKINIPIVFRLD